MAANTGMSFESREISWPLDDTTMDGTLAVPAGPGPYPAVVLVAGSGPTDRDWNSPLLPDKNGSGRLLAEALAGGGFVTLRYDKRASGPRVAENMPRLIGKISMQSHTDELTAAVQQLAAQPAVDRARIFALTNSEGALHALNYQMHAPAIPFAGIVLTAPPGRAISAVAHMQIAAMLTGAPDAERLLQHYEEATARFAAGEPANPDPALPQGALMLLGGLETPANLPFSRELWLADAAAWLAQVSVPVLVVIGKKDIQVDWQADGGPLEQAAAGRPNVTFVYPPDANHVLKHEPRPRAELNAANALPGYNSPESVLDPEALAKIQGWLAAQV